MSAHQSPLRIAVFASGSGSNFQAIVDRIVAGQLNAQITMLICNNRNAPVLERARKANIRAEHWSETLAGSSEKFVERLLRLLNSAHPDLIVLAGYMKLLPAEVVHAYEGRILNIHPALLPKFGGEGMYGMRVHEAVLAAGESQSGATVHFVDNEYDRGAIFLQRTVPVQSGDTPGLLRDRVLAVEHTLLPEAIAKFIAERHCPDEPKSVHSPTSRKEESP